MRHLFSPAGLKHLQTLTPDKTLLAFDFDGTLAPLGDDPVSAVTLPSLARHLKRLSADYVTAIISGRSVSNLRRRLGFTPDFVIGNHGLEGIESFKSHATLAKARTKNWHKKLEQKWPELSDSKGLILERKQHSLSLHYRLSADKARSARELKELAESLWPRPRIIEGHDIYNLVLRNSPHKGHALRHILRKSRLQQALFVGDDVTDEDVFCMFDERILTVRVGRSRKSCADYFVKNMQEMNRLLEALAKGRV